MSHSAYPTATDLQTYLQSACGITMTAAAIAQLTQVTASASAEFERLTQRRFLGTGATSTEYVDLPTVWQDNRMLAQLPQCLATSPTPVVVYQPLNSTATTWTLATEYDFLPNNAADMGVPYEWLSIYNMRATLPLPYVQRKSVQITGKWFFGNVPEDAWLAVLQRGAALAGPMLAIARTRGFVSWNEGDGGPTETYGPEAYGKSIDRWEANWRVALNSYRRLGF